MIHTADHQPVELHQQCETCRYILRRVFNDILPDVPLGPNGPEMLIERIKEIAGELNAIGAAS